VTSAPVITFLSDYGLGDEFTGVCHGVIATICPQARVIDITHGVPRHDVRAGALMLRAALPFMPVGVHLAVVDPDVGAERRAVALRLKDRRMLVGPDNGLLRLPGDTPEFAINASNRRHWSSAVRGYVDECLAGTAGPRGRDFNMRWIASIVAEAYRILGRGGVYLYPRDARPACRNGRLRLVYEANPVAWLIEQAGGAATDGMHRILDLLPAGPHQRVPLVFGSRDQVERVAAYCAGHHLARERSPLFGHRGLFRADTGMRLPAGGVPCR
jgi:hypothetical protein